MFQVSQHPSSGVLKTVTTASGTGHNTGTATSLQRWREVAVPVCEYFINLLTPNVNYSGRTTPLTSKVAFHIFIQQI